MNEQYVRRMRANVYGECSDSNWNACKENWMRQDSIQWLQSLPENSPTQKQTKK